MSSSSPLIRLIPLQPSQLPSHPLLASTNNEETTRPDLLPFTLALLDQTANALHPMAFNMYFKPHSSKPSPPSNTSVEALIYSLTSSDVSSIDWADPSQTAGVGRAKPRDIPAEHWFARRSYHANIPSKVNRATASWDEFVFGLRDNHSKNEAEFTPTIYDPRHILNWNDELDAASKEWSVEQRNPSEGPGKSSYTRMTLAVYEMCHELPFPLGPRCFPILVATASMTDKSFIAVTVPVNLTSFDGAFYSNGRNRTEGEDATRRKQVVLALYTAIEKCELSVREVEGKLGESPVAGEGKKQTEETIEWIMATASDAKGNLPMAVQKRSMPGEVVKDVGHFLSWINTVDDAVIKGEKSYESTRNSAENGERKRSRTGSSAR